MKMIKKKNIKMINKNLKQDHNINPRINLKDNLKKTMIKIQKIITNMVAIILNIKILDMKVQ